MAKAKVELSAEVEAMQRERVAKLGLSKAEQNKVLKALGCKVQVETFSRFDYEVESGANKGKSFPMLMVAEGSKQKAIPLWVCEVIRKNLDDFIINLDYITEQITEEKKQ